MTKFVSRFSDYTITLRPDDSYKDTRTNRIVIEPGKHVSFTRNVFTTNDKEVVKALKDHPNYGRDFWVGPQETKNLDSVLNKEKEKIEKAQEEEEKKESVSPEFKNWTKQALIRYAKTHGINVSTNGKKSKIIETIQNKK